MSNSLLFIGIFILNMNYLQLVSDKISSKIDGSNEFSKTFVYHLGMDYLFSISNVYKYYKMKMSVLSHALITFLYFFISQPFGYYFSYRHQEPFQ